MKLFFLTCFFLGLCFAGIAIKIWSKKDGKFAGTCASQSPFLNKKDEPCGICGKLPQDQNCSSVDPQSN
ncbi:MAG: membrane or secreted protein [Flavobacteriaceae bacterium]|nr:membrane or secreted protein [Flavobacteriaceae bacterium]|tara:strand:+ start:1550 stop:1756 length:207 start_codon:yes stop_codon:yes gene_type:complete